MDRSPITSPPASLFGSPLHHSSHNSFPIIAVAIIGILATAFLLVSYYIFVIKCCLNWHRIDLLRRFSFSRRRRVEDPLTVYSPAVENRGLDEAAIRSIPISKFKKDHEVFEKTSCECAVCLNEFQEEEKLRVIPNCGHFFHIDCIDVWLQNNANCPLCRTSISSNTCCARFPHSQFLDPNPSPQDPNLHTDENYVVIEISSENHHPTNPSLSRIPENPSSNEVLTISSSPKPKIPRKKAKKFSHISSMGDECIDNRQKDEQFVVQLIRRSFSMDSAADTQLYLAVQEIIQRNKAEINEVSPNEGSSSSRIRRSFFSFGSRSAVQVQPLVLDSV
ncbi:hypothetical protein BUALT_Bualt14G0112900 [Buddleja alternifolia]|uniref:RING-type E3 ubiquitin transferase n=1 Tax=Buddleja alternifolia TaxID=168488 RepID=A0AAV6WRF1_9LAMI|nr:hypothetical protein BUALT_Bualt14G0112900 [Buddleja alternifolia]